MTYSTAKGTHRDKSEKSFVKSPIRDRFTAQETVVTNTDQDPVKVEFSNPPNEIQYNELTIAAGNLQEILGKIVASGKKVILKRLWVESDNLARFDVKLNGQIKVSIKNYYTKFDRFLDFQSLELLEADIFKVEAQNLGDTPADFRTSLLFSETDV